MGRPFLEKFSDVQWEVNEDHLQAWKDGRTGFPIVDAAMRACKARGLSSIIEDSAGSAYGNSVVGESGTDGHC